MLKKLKLRWYLRIYEFHYDEYFKKLNRASGINNPVLKSDIRRSAQYNQKLMRDAIKKMVELIPPDEWVKVSTKYVEVRSYCLQ